MTNTKYTVTLNFELSDERLKEIKSNPEWGNLDETDRNNVLYESAQEGVLDMLQAAYNLNVDDNYFIDEVIL